MGNSATRQSSPLPGRSIWITSAPISAAIAAAKGSATMVPVESMRTPWSGPNRSVTNVGSDGSIHGLLGVRPRQ